MTSGHRPNSLSQGGGYSGCSPRCQDAPSRPDLPRGSTAPFGES